MRYFSIRFVDAGGGIKNVMDLDDAELEIVQQKMDEYGLSVSTLGSPLGKVKLLDVDDGTKTPYRPFEEYLANEVPKACELTNALGRKADSWFFILSSARQQHRRSLCSGGGSDWQDR